MHEKGGRVEGLEHNLSGRLAILCRVEHGFCHNCRAIVYAQLQLFVKNVVPDPLHVIKVCNKT
jgi:hypothetical protein